MESRLIFISNKCVPCLHWEAVFFWIFLNECTYFMIHKVRRTRRWWRDKEFISLHEFWAEFWSLRNEKKKRSLPQSLLSQSVPAGWSVPCISNGYLAGNQSLAGVAQSLWNGNHFISVVRVRGFSLVRLQNWLFSGDSGWACWWNLTSEGNNK